MIIIFLQHIGVLERKGTKGTKGGKGIKETKSKNDNK